MILIGLATDPVVTALTPSARAILARPDRVTAYAVDGNEFVKHPPLNFRDAIAARKLTPAEGKRAVGAFYATLRDVRTDVLLACFDPHHGLRFERGKRWVKVWICYTCRATEIEESGHPRFTVGSGVAGRKVIDALVPKVKGAADPPPIVP